MLRVKSLERLLTFAFYSLIVGMACGLGCRLGKVRLFEKVKGDRQECLSHGRGQALPYPPR